MDALSFDKDKLLDQYNPDFAMAYGSGVFKQTGYTQKDKQMIDLVFGVDSTFDWHTLNLKKNSSDYSLLVKIIGAQFANYLQEKGAKIYYHPYVKFENSTVKYGVIEVDDLIQDLREWQHLYVAGRLHKPVQILKSNSEVEKAIEINLHHALNTALFLLPEDFSEEDLFMTIAGLSYTGDSRMKYAENPNKVANIVGKNLHEFKNLYEETLKGKSKIITLLNDGKIQQDTNPRLAQESYNELPINLLSKIQNPSFDKREELAEKIKAGIAEIVNVSSKTQTLKGFLTSGVAKSVKYVYEKLEKSKRK